MSKPTTVVTHVSPVILFGQKVQGIGIIKSGDQTLGMVNYLNKTVIQGDLTKEQKAKVAKLIKE